MTDPDPWGKIAALDLSAADGLPLEELLRREGNLGGQTAHAPPNIAAFSTSSA